MPFTILPGSSSWRVVGRQLRDAARHIDIALLAHAGRRTAPRNWMIPGKMVKACAPWTCRRREKVVVIMGALGEKRSQLLNRCNLPLDRAGVVDMVITISVSS